MDKEIKPKIDLGCSEISFKVKHLTITNVRGIFKKYHETILTCDKDFSIPNSHFHVSAGFSNTKRDKHLNRLDFFEIFTIIMFEKSLRELIDNDIKSWAIAMLAKLRTDLDC